MQETIKTLEDVQLFLSRKNLKVLNGSLLFDLGDDLLFILGTDQEQHIKSIKKDEINQINIAPNHCHVTVDFETIRALLIGSMKSHEAYTSGKLRLSGSSAVALKLQNLLG